MDNDSLFSPNVKTEFDEYLSQNPNNRRVSKANQDTLIRWLTDDTTPPVSQQESSRRHYVKKTFAWNAQEQVLISLPKGNQGKTRRVVAEDKIMDVVGEVHESNHHGGWDATWKDVSNNYYGILRADVIFLLKKCDVCARDPRKQPKGSPSTQLADMGTTTSSSGLSLEDLIYGEQNSEMEKTRTGQPDGLFTSLQLDLQESGIIGN